MQNKGAGPGWVS